MALEVRQKSARLIGCLALCFAAAAHGEDSELSSRSRAILAEPAKGVAPFAARVESTEGFFARGPVNGIERAVACADGLTLVCYDMRDRGVVYRGARQFMPHVQGFTPDGVALRHDRIIVRYTFR